MRKLIMLAALSQLFFSCLLIIPYVPQNDPPTEEDMKADPDSARSVGYMSAPEKEVVYFLNLVRRDPKAFAEKYLAAHRDSKDGEECYQELRKTAPRPVLKPSQTLSLSAQDHALDMGRTGREGHVGSNGSTLQRRIERRGRWSYTAGENCSYGYDSAVEMVIGLLIDSGVPDRGHRRNILNPDFRYVGVGIRPHTVYGTNCVQDFAGGIDK